MTQKFNISGRILHVRRLRLTKTKISERRNTQCQKSVARTVVTANTRLPRTNISEKAETWIFIARTTKNGWETQRENAPITKRSEY